MLVVGLILAFGLSLFALRATKNPPRVDPASRREANTSIGTTYLRAQTLAEAGVRAVGRCELCLIDYTERSA